MKIIFFGLGSIGQRHARALIKLGGHELYALRTQLSDAPAPDFPVKELKSWQEIDAVKPQVAFITNPTSMHISTAIECAKRGMALFMEKPLGSSIQGLDELLALIQEKQITSYVAYCMRFYPSILYLKKILEKEPCCHMRIEACSYLPTWRPGRDHRISYSSKKDLGGGIVFDLSHEIDYVEFLLGQVQSIEGDCSRRSNVTVDAEDSADMQIQAEGSFATVNLSYLSHINRRQMTIDFADKTMVANLLTHQVGIYKENKLIEEKSFAMDRDDLFRHQLEYFFVNINNPKMMNNVTQAAGLFRKICRFREKNNVA